MSIKFYWQWKKKILRSNTKGMLNVQVVIIRDLSGNNFSRGNAWDTSDVLAEKCTLAQNDSPGTVRQAPVRIINQMIFADIISVRSCGVRCIRMEPINTT